jgi:hypothetical protein
MSVADNETARARTTRIFWKTVMGDKWAWLCLAVFGLAGTGAGIYLAWGHARTATVVLTVTSAAIGLLAGLAAVFTGLWLRGPTVQRDEARHERDAAHVELTALQNPPVTLHLADKLQLIPILPADAAHLRMAEGIAPGVAITRVTAYWIRVDNASTIDLSGVRVRIMSTEPSEASVDLPHDLQWRTGGSATARDIPADGHDYAVITTRVDLEDNRTIWTGPVAPALLQATSTPFRLDIEVWWDGKSRDSTTLWLAQGEKPHAPPTTGGH